MENVFDITTFGAKSDGITDCTIAIQDAIDAAAAVKGAVIVPPGQYLCGYVKMKPSVSLSGFHGWGYREQGGSVLICNDENAKCVIDMTGAFGACVKGIQLNGNRLLGNNIHGIMADWDKYNGGTFDDGSFDNNALPEPTHTAFREDNFVISDCQCKNFSGDGIHLNHIFAFTVCDCQLMANKGDGIFVNGWDGWIHDCIIHTNLGAGIGSYEKENGIACITSVTITGNRIEWNHKGGIYVQQCSDSLNINNNFFDRSGNVAIYLSGLKKDYVRDITIVGNIFRRSGGNFKERDTDFVDAHLFMNNASNITVTGNACRDGVDDGGSGTRSPKYGFVIHNSNNCIISSNTMKIGYTEKNIVCENAENVLVINNVG